MPVLQRKELEDSPLADLHAIASELGVEGYRTQRKADLVNTILSVQGGDDSAPAEEEPADEEVAVVEAAEDEAEPDEAEPDDAEPDEVPEDEVLEARPRRRRRRGGRRAAEEGPAVEEEPEVVEDEVSEETVVSGVLDILPNGSGFVRGEGEEAYVSPAQIRRCELRPGDELSGPVRPPRRNERHPSLIRVDSVNGHEAEPPEQRPLFEELTPVFPSARLTTPAVLESVPIGRGARVAVAGAPGAGATTLLRELAQTVGGEADVELQVVLAGVRPEELAEWREAAGPAGTVGGSFETAPDTLAQAAELAVERAKRRVERGAHAVVVIDSLEGLSAGAARRVFGAGRATEEGGTLTVIAAVGEATEPLRWATSRVVLAEPSDGSGPSVDASRSATLRADRLS